MASLAEALYNLPTERLRALVQTRKMDTKKLALIPNKRQLAQFMANELSKPASITEAIQECNARELRLLQLLLSSEGERIMPWHALEDAAGGRSLASALRRVVIRLEDLGLAFLADTGVYVPEVVKNHVPASLPDRYSLVRCLNGYDAMALKRICENLGLPSDTKGINIEAIRSALIDRGPGLHLNRPLDAQERAVLEFMVQNGGVTTAMEVALAVLEGQTDDFFRYDWQNRWKQGKGRNAIDRLLGRGILHVVSHNYGYNLFLIVPGDLLRNLSGDTDIAFWTGAPPAPKALAVPPVAITQHTTLARDVVTLLGFISMQDAVRTNTGHIHKTSLKNLARQLSLPDERYASFLYALCRSTDLIHPMSDKQVYAITAQGNSWLCWDTLTQTRVLYEGWRNGTLWGEMYADPLEKSSDYRAKETIVAMRRSVLNILTEPGITATSSIVADAPATNLSPVGATTPSLTVPSLTTPGVTTTTGEVFYEITSVTDAMTYRSPLMLAYTNSMGPNLVPSPAIFVRLLITECLYWLGLVELGWHTPPPTNLPLEPAAKPTGRGATQAVWGEPAQRPPAPEAIAYRLNPMGAYLLGLPGAPPPPEAPREKQFIVQANAEIFVPPYLELDTLYHLLTLTEAPAKGATGNTVSLTRDSIRRCLDNGETPHDILAFLQAHARTGIPQNVEYLINEVSGKHGHIHIGKAQMYLQVDSPLLLQELQSRRELKPYFVRALSDTVAVLKADDPDKLLRDLRKTGYLPVSDDAPHVRTLGLKTRPAPTPAPPPGEQEQEAGRSRKSDASLDWKRIAQEDGNRWEYVPKSAMSSNRVKNPQLIKVLLTQAIRQRSQVEMEYQASDAATSSVRLVEPLRLTGDLLLIHDLTRQEEDIIDLTGIRWARLNG